MSAGPVLPVPMIFPCSINIDDENIFVFGQEMVMDNIFTSPLQAFIFNTRTSTWTNMTNSLSCVETVPHLSKFTCAYLRPMKTVIVGITNCTSTLNVTSLTWMPINSELPRNDSRQNNSEKYLTDKITLELNNSRNNA